MYPRVIVCGSRKLKDREVARQAVKDRLIALHYNTIIVHGMASGIDTIADQEAKQLGLQIDPHPADWAKHKHGAGHIRNEEMARAGAILCIAFWNGESTGTQDMLRRAQHHGIPTETIPV